MFAQKIISMDNRVRYFRGRVSNFNQSEERKQCFLPSDWLKFETLPREYRTLLDAVYFIKDNIFTFTKDFNLFHSLGHLLKQDFYSSWTQTNDRRRFVSRSRCLFWWAGKNCFAYPFAFRRIYRCNFGTITSLNKNNRP